MTLPFTPALVTGGTGTHGHPSAQGTLPMHACVQTAAHLHLLSHTPLDRSLGEVSKEKSHFYFHSLLSIAACMCVCMPHVHVTH